MKITSRRIINLGVGAKQTYKRHKKTKSTASLNRLTMLKSLPIFMSQTELLRETNAYFIDGSISAEWWKKILGL